MARILIVANFLVPPIIAGSCKCVDSYAKILQKKGHDIYFLYSGKENDVEIEIAKTYWGKSFLYYKYSFLLRSANFLKRKLLYYLTRKKYTTDYYYPLWGLLPYINRLQDKYNFDSIIVNYIWMTKIFDKVKIKNKFLFTHDSFTNKIQRIGQECYSLSSAQESKGLHRCDQILSIQKNESIFFHHLAPKVPVYTVYTPFQYNQSLITHSKNILFFSGDSDINLNGLFHFLKNVLPHIVSYEKSACLLIAGSICKSLQKTKLPNCVKLLGFVEDVDKFYALGDVVINPVFQGTGLKIKTLEGISYGKVVITHPHSIEGLYKNGNSVVFVANNDHEYVSLVVDALQDKIDKEKTMIYCEQYIKEMNSYISKQYDLINFV